MGTSPTWNSADGGVRAADSADVLTLRDAEGGQPGFTWTRHPWRAWQRAQPLTWETSGQIGWEFEGLGPERPLGCGQGTWGDFPGSVHVQLGEAPGAPRRDEGQSGIPG